jgi:hypothetical protein
MESRSDPSTARQLRETVRPTQALTGPERCRRKFLKYFPGGFDDETYLDWERTYKWTAHQRWMAELGRADFRAQLDAGAYRDIASRAVAIEARTNLLFSFEKMALRDAVRDEAGARTFATALFAFLHGTGSERARFEQWRDAVATLPRRQTRVLTWPLLTIFGFIAQPRRHMFLKPTVTRLAADRYGYPFAYRSTPNWDTYQSLLALAGAVKEDLGDLHPKDLIDVQSFLWVQGSEEYPGR